MLKSVWKLSSSSDNGLSAGEAEPGDADGLMTSYGLSVHRIDMRAWGLKKVQELSGASGTGLRRSESRTI